MLAWLYRVNDKYKKLRAIEERKRQEEWFMRRVVECYNAMLACYFQPRKGEYFWDCGSRAFQEIYGAVFVSLRPWKEFVTLTVTSTWFAVDIDGVVHRAGYLTHDTYNTTVTLCDVRTPRLEPRLEQPQKGGAIVTCMACLQCA